MDEGPKKNRIDRTEIGIVRKLVRSNLRGKALDISEKELDYFEEYPFEIDRLTSAMAVKKIYIGIAFLVGVVMVSISIFIENHRFFQDGLLSGIGTDLLFEGGVALWGASLTVYLLEIIMDKQEMVNRRYRLEIERKLDQRSSEVKK